MKNRILALISALKKDSSALVISSAPRVIRTRDIHYPYRQDSDFFYLTGSTEPGLTLFLSGSESKGYLIGSKPTAKAKIWEGSGEAIQARAKILGLELILTDKPLDTVKNLSKNHHVIWTQNKQLTPSGALNEFINKLSPLERGTYPSVTSPIEELLHPLRLRKEPFEIEAISNSCSITMQAIFHSAELIRPGSSELIVAKTVDYWFGALGGAPGFETIAASGKNAAILHYRNLSANFKKDDLLLLDCGAESNMYCADISRVFPVSGKFEGVKKEIYSIVLEAQKKAISIAKPGIKIKAVYNAANDILIQGLKDLKVLSGSKDVILKKEQHKIYFPHGIGHSLGIDVHDVGNHRGNNEALLQEGMVFTIEPGLYFSKSVGKVPACGIRIEDDIYITKKGAHVLTSSIPKEISEIEALMIA